MLKIDDMPRRISVGRTLDNGYSALQIDCGEWVKRHPQLTTYRIEVKRPDGEMYFADTTFADGVLTWNINAADTAIAGDGEFQVVAIGTDRERKTSSHPIMFVSDIIAGTASETPPEANKAWTDRVIEETQKSATQAAASAAEAKETLESIPADYTELTQEVGKLSEENAKIIDAFPKHGKSIQEFPVEWAQGTLLNGVEEASTRRIRSSRIPVGMGLHVKSLDPDAYVYAYSAYDSSDTFIGYFRPGSQGQALSGSGFSKGALIADTLVNIYPFASYFRMVARKESDSEVITPEESNVLITRTVIDECWNGQPLDDFYVLKYKAEYSESDISFIYDVDETIRNKGFLKLPHNYTPNGMPVPLIVFVHGSADISSINAQIMTSNYDAYYNFLRDSGYAVFDCYGYGTKYTSETGGSSNTWGLPINRKCYAAGIRYVCEKYNIDIDNVFVSCKSLGGLQALSMYYDEGLPIKAVGMLAPELDIFNVNMGYSVANKRTVAAELDFAEDTGNVLAFAQGDAVPDGFWDYITANMSKWVGHFAFFNGLPINASDKATYYRKGSTTGDMCRTSLNRPVKIWIAEDDNYVSYGVALAFIQSLNNGGYKGELRTMPAGTGGHHAVDYDANALQTTNVTTKCGIAYESIPTAYYELVQFFDKYYKK